MSRTLNDTSTADVILRPSGIQVKDDILAHKDVLARHSAIFAAASEASGGATTAQEQHDGRTLDVVECSENKSTLERLVQYLYQDDKFPAPQNMEFSAVFALAEAAEKYEVWTLKQMLLAFLRERVAAYPYSIFTFACRHGYKALAVDAAMRTFESGRGALEPPGLKAALLGSTLAMAKWKALRQVLWANGAFKDHLQDPPSQQKCFGGTSFAGVCRLWDPFYNDIMALSEMASRTYVKSSVDVPSAIYHGITNTLKGCNSCVDRAERWSVQYIRGKKADVEAAFSKT